MKKRLLLAFGTLLIVLAAAGAAMWFWPVFSVEKITVNGNQQVSSQTVVDAAAVPLGTNLLRVNEADVAARIAADPWVRSVNVTRSLPDTLVVTLSERTAVLYEEEADGPHLIDERGQAFVIADPPVGAVKVTGTAATNSTTMTALVDIVTALSPELRAQVGSVSAQSAYEVEFTLGDGRTIYWGANEDNAAKARAMAVVITREGQHWDVSNPELVTVA